MKKTLRYVKKSNLHKILKVQFIEEEKIEHFKSFLFLNYDIHIISSLFYYNPNHNKLDFNNASTQQVITKNDSFDIKIMQRTAQ